jgi:hypothetical protein
VTGLVTAKMRDLADSLADLKVRLRVALAGELAQHVAKAVGDVVRTLVAGRSEVVGPRPPTRPWDEQDPWGEEEDDLRRVDPHEREPRDEDAVATLPASAAAPVAIAAAVHVIRWWLGRKGHLLGAIGIGLGVGFLGLTGGTLVRSALAALTAAADLIAVTDTLDNSTTRLQPI